jgi:anti-sigma B factor antagonist
MSTTVITTTIAYVQGFSNLVCREVWSADAFGQREDFDVECNAGDRQSCGQPGPCGTPRHGAAMTAISMDGRALSIVCDRCGRTEQQLTDSTPTWQTAWAKLRLCGWSGSAMSVGDHYCDTCGPPEPDGGLVVRVHLHPAMHDLHNSWLSVHDVDGVVVVAVAGELDLRVDADFNYALARAVESSDRLLLSMANVDLIDSTIIRTMVRAVQSVQATGGRLALLQPPARVRRILDVLGLTEIFPIFTDLDDALNHLRPRRPSTSAGMNGAPSPTDAAESMIGS